MVRLARIELAASCSAGKRSTRMPGEDIDEASISVMHQGDEGGKLGRVDWLYVALVLVMLAGLIVVWSEGVRLYVNSAGRPPHLTVPRSRRAKGNHNPPEPPEGHWG